MFGLVNYTFWIGKCITSDICIGIRTNINMCIDISIERDLCIYIRNKCAIWIANVVL